MTTKEALLEISGHNATFQIECDEMPRQEIRVRKEDDLDLKEKKILSQFGEQNWTKIEFDGYIPTYCPEAIAEELKRKKQSMYDHFARFGCD